MKIPMSWLGDYVNMDGITPREYAAALTMSGSMVEGIENPGDEIQNVVTAKILSVEQHPDADKLKVCQVDQGDKTVQIITGADNIAVGQIIPLAKDGSVLPGGVKIKKGKLRGLDSCGMMCSHEELGLSADEVPNAVHGILILDPSLPVGMDIREVFHMNEHIVDFDITSNRPDCFSMIGLARETAVTFGRELNVKQPEVKPGSGDIADEVKVSVNAPDCLRYCARLVKNVKIAPSPDWMQRRLKACGIRAINNIVDITNYVLLEYGQPMHAFDLRYIDGNEIVVRKAREGEPMTTLDGSDHTLDASMLVISDKSKAVAVAGVMGGENSEVMEDTATVLFESAAFDAASVRVTARKLGLRTESSARYEKGLDPNNAAPALQRACELVQLLGCGEVVNGMLDVYPTPVKPVQLTLDAQKINAFLGTDISKEDMVKTLKALEFGVEGDVITAPTFRPDIQCMADVAEEVVRIYGYDKIPSTLLRAEFVPGHKTAVQKQEDVVRETLTACGLYETVSYTFTEPKAFDKLCLPSDSPLRGAVKISNPLGEETSLMRTTVLGSMLDIIARNVSFQTGGAKLFELGKVFQPHEGLPTEQKMVAVGMYGGDVTFYTLKGVIEQLMEALNIKKYRVTPESNNPTFHPGRTASLVIGKQTAGVFGQLHPAVCKNYGVDCEVYAAELNFAALCNAAGGSRSFEPLPKYPAVVRDLALLVDDGVLAADIQEVMKKKAGNLFETLTLFDVYKGKQVPEGKKSMAYSITLRAADRTLTDEDVNTAVGAILEALKQKFGAELR